MGFNQKKPSLSCGLLVLLTRKSVATINGGSGDKAVAGGSCRRFCPRCGRGDLCYSCPAFNGAREEALSEKKKMKANKKSPKEYWEMNKEELAEATREFNQELRKDDFHPLGPEKRALWERLRQQEVKAPRRTENSAWVRLCSLEDERVLREKIKKAGAALTQCIRKMKARNPLEVLKEFKLDPLGFDPYDPGHKMNLVEQINQSATLLVAGAAVERLLGKHPSREGYVISRPTSKGYDLWAVDASVAAEVFAATCPGNNQKIIKDLAAVLKNKEPFERDPPRFRYIFFVSGSLKGFPPSFYPLQGPRHDSTLGEVWCLIEHGRCSVTIVPLPEAAVFSP